MSTVEWAVAWLRKHEVEMERLLAELVEINSHTENTAGVAQVGARLREELARIPGLEIALAGDSKGARYAPHLLAATRAVGPRVLLIGHMDTVFPPGTFEGYRIEGDRAYGPGVFDMKGGLVVIASALRALAEAGALEPLAVTLVAVSDEEVGSPESQFLLGTIVAKQATSCALVFESGRPGDAIVTQRKGTGNAIVRAHGRAAHAGNDHAQGANAIWALAHFIDRAQQFTNYARGVTVNVGRIEGGHSKNTVPDAATAWVDFRFVSQLDGELTLQELGNAARESAKMIPGTSMTVESIIGRPALERTQASVALYQAYAECQSISGLGTAEAPLQGGASDANTLSAIGIPVIDGLGPRGGKYHTKDEFIDRSSLVPKAEALVRFLLSWGSG